MTAAARFAESAASSARHLLGEGGRVDCRLVRLGVAAAERLAPALDGQGAPKNRFNFDSKMLMLACEPPRNMQLGDRSCRWSSHERAPSSAAERLQPPGSIRDADSVDTKKVGEIVTGHLVNSMSGAGQGAGTFDFVRASAPSDMDARARLPGV
jgi:hypothetical protein